MAEIRSSKADFEDFKRSFVWNDLKSWISEKRESFQALLLSESNQLEIGRLQGAIKELMLFEELPEIIIESLDIDEKGESNEDYAG